MSTTVSFRMNPESARELKELCDTTDRPKAWHAEQAMKNYLDLQRWQIEHIRKGIKEIEEGKGIPHEVVMRKLDRMIKTAKRRRK